MKCHALILAGAAGDNDLWDSFLTPIYQSFSSEQFPFSFPVHIYIEVEVDDGHEGIPTDVRIELESRATDKKVIFDATGVSPLRVSEGVPALFTMRHQVSLEFDQPGRYELKLYVEGASVAERSIPVTKTRVPDAAV